MELLFVLLFLGIGLTSTVFWIWMIIHCACGRFPNDTEKIIWLIVIILLGIIGAIIYFFARKAAVDGFKDATICPGCKLVKPKTPQGQYICSRCGFRFAVDFKGTTYPLY